MATDGAVSLALGVLAVTSPVALVQATPLTPTVAGGSKDCPLPSRSRWSPLNVGQHVTVEAQACNEPKVLIDEQDGLSTSG